MAQEGKLKKAEIVERIDYAQKTHATAITFMQDAEDLFTGAYVIQSDLEDQGLTPVVPAKPRAILSKMLAMLAVRAALDLEVVPRGTSGKEDEVCTKLEHWLKGFQRTIRRQARKPIYLDWRFWFLFRGRGDLELRYVPELAKQGMVPLRVLADDPMTIFPVWGHEGIVFYAKVYKASVLELKRMPVYADWKLPDVEGKPIDDLVDVKEYWDPEWHAAIVGDKLVYSKQNPFGFVPLAEAQAERTPLAAMEWAAQAVLYPVMNSLKLQAQLMGKVTNAVEVFYWPLILAEVPGGKSVVLHTSPGEAVDIPQGARVQVLTPTPNQGLVEVLNGWLQSDINLYTIPEIAWGVEPSNLQAGFAIAQVLGQVLDRIQEKKEELELAASWHFGDILRAVEKFGGGKTKFAVDVALGKKGERSKVLEIGPEDVDGHYEVACSLNPELPSDQIYKMRMAVMARQPGSDGKPFLPDSYIRREIYGVKEPDLVDEELEKQVMAATEPIIMAKQRADYLEKWKKEQGISDEEFAKLTQVLQAATQPGPQAASEGKTALAPPGTPAEAPEERYPSAGTEEEVPSEEELGWRP